ncbi:hypothetical protein [Nocardioides caricicola]|uniref:SPW repeat-containing protein n=1 Tax=Nocardioides caricicola TaxID=634770 RepID=A0ABW0N6H8_9ACTN
MRKALAAAGLLLVGAATAIATVGLHQIWWGFVLAFTATFVTAYALPPGWWSRLAFVAGWAAMLGWLTVPRDAGDYLVSSDLAGYSLLGLGVVLVVFAVATLPRPRMRS